MKKSAIAQRVFLLIMLVLVSGCGGSPNIQVNEISNNTVSYDETIHINNCGGKADSEQTASRTFAATIEGGAEFSAGYQSIVEGGVSAKYSQYRNVSKSQRLIAPPATNMEFVLRWSEDIHAGNVTVNGVTGNYEVRVPVVVEQISSQDLGCGTAQNQQQPSSSPTTESSPNAQPLSNNGNSIISLKDVGSFVGQNLGLAPGTYTFNGVEFETGWIATTQSNGGSDENKPSTYKVVVQNYTINSSKVYLLLQASWAVGRNTDEIGSVNIHISNRQMIQEKIIVGYNIRDWSNVGNTLSAPSAQEAYSDGNGVVDMFFISIPEEYNGYEITQIDIQDTSEAMGVHLWAITIK